MAIINITNQLQSLQAKGLSFQCSGTFTCASIDKNTQADALYFWWYGSCQMTYNMAWWHIGLYGTIYKNNVKNTMGVVIMNVDQIQSRKLWTKLETKNCYLSSILLIISALSFTISWSDSILGFHIKSIAKFHVCILCSPCWFTNKKRCPL